MSSTTVASRRTRWCPRGGRDGPAAPLEQVAHRQQVQRGIERMQAVAPRAVRTHNLHRAGGRFRATVVHARLRALDTAGVLGPDRQSLPGYVGRDVLAGACVPTPGPAGAVPVRVRSRSSVGLRWRRGRLWHPRRLHRPPCPGTRCGGRRFAALARRVYVLGILSSRPSQVSLPKPPYPNAARMSRKGARPRKPAHAGSGGGPKRGGWGVRRTLSPLKRTGKGVSSAINPYESAR